MDTKRFPELIRKIYAIVGELENMFPGQQFTPDGHMVGSLGEAWAAYYYGIELFPSSSQGHDGKKGEHLVQIKTTQRHTVSLSSEPQHLLVLSLSREGTFSEVYNGPGTQVWNLVCAKPLPKNGQYQVRIKKLQELTQGVPNSKRLKPLSLVHDMI